MHLFLVDNAGISVKVEAMVYFTVSCMYYFIPCVLGSFINVVVTNRNKQIKKSKYVSKAIFLAIVPAVLTFILSEVFGDKVGNREEIFLACGFALGLCGDQITSYAVKVKGLATLIKAFQQFKADAAIFTDEQIENLSNIDSDLSNIDENTSDSDSPKNDKSESKNNSSTSE